MTQIQFSVGLTLCFLSCVVSFSSMPPPPKPKAPLTWREKVDVLLDPRTSIAEREILSRDLLAEIPEIQADVKAASERGGARAVLNDVVLASGSEARRTRDGLRSVTRQVVRDILPSLPEQLLRLPGQVLFGARRASSKAKQAASKPAKLPKPKVKLDKKSVVKGLKSAKEELLNAVSRTPTGLYSPEYEVLETGPPDESQGGIPSYEIRRYTQYATATTLMDSAKSKDGTVGQGNAFNTLAGYLFGGNEESSAMGMTTPVIMEIEGDTAVGKSMSFVLPKDVPADSAPRPLTNDVTVREVPSELVAAREFTGFATDREVQLQLSALRLAIASAGWEEADSSVSKDEKYRLLQYNSPFTLPWVRRNEVIVRVKDNNASDNNIENDIGEYVVGKGIENVSAGTGVKELYEKSFGTDEYAVGKDAEDVSAGTGVEELYKDSYSNADDVDFGISPENT